MNNVKKWYYERLALRTVKSLCVNGMNAVYAATAQEAKKMALDMVPHDAAIGLGGSVTLQEIGLLDAFNEGSYNLLTSTAGNLPDDEKYEQRRRGLTADYFFTSTNAVTLDGKLVNIDGSGNRVAAMIFGPKKVIVIAGANKITRNLEEALNRCKEAAVLNAKRLEKSKGTPCNATGKCENCNSKGRICNVTTIMEKKPSSTDYAVIIVGEELGY